MTNTVTQAIDRRDHIGARRPCKYVSSRLLGVASAESISIPSGAKYVILAPTIDAHFSFTGTAAVPADVDDGTASEMVKASSPETDGRTFLIPDGATTLSVISAAACTITASFFQS